MIMAPGKNSHDSSKGRVAIISHLCYKKMDENLSMTYDS
jgi:hypothetical protein